MKCQITIVDMRPDDCSSEFSRSITPLICSLLPGQGWPSGCPSGWLVGCCYIPHVKDVLQDVFWDAGCPSHHSWLKDALHSFSRPSTCFPKRGGMHRALLSISCSGAIGFHTKKCVPRSERNGVHFARVAISRFGPIAFHARGCVFRTASVTECILCVSLTLHRLLRLRMCVRHCERNCVHFVVVVI